MQVDDEILKLLPGSNSSSTVPSKRPQSGGSSSSSSRMKLSNNEKSPGLNPNVSTTVNDKLKHAQSYYLKKSEETSTGKFIAGPSPANPIIPSFSSI